MTYVYTSLAISIITNIFLVWYLIRLLKKFFFVSENIADLYLITRAFQAFVRTLFSMDSYHGEPMIQELIHRIKDVNEEIERFREVFVYMLDEQLEEEFDDITYPPETREE